MSATLDTPDTSKKEIKEQADNSFADPLASTEQVLKAATIIAQQKPSRSRLQRAMPFLSDILKADLSRINRYDMCCSLGVPMPFGVYPEEIPLEIDNETPIERLFVKLKEQGISFCYGDLGQQREFGFSDHKDARVGKANFLLVQGNNNYASYDLVLATQRETFALAMMFAAGFKLKRSLTSNSVRGFGIQGFDCEVLITTQPANQRVQVSITPTRMSWNFHGWPFCNLVRRASLPD